MEMMESEEAKVASGNWTLEEAIPTKRLVDWCQDQWRRKNIVDLCTNNPNVVITQAYLMPLFGERMPLCLNCGTPCPECRVELGHDIPQSMSTAHALMEGVDQEDETLIQEPAEPPKKKNKRRRKR